MGTMEELSVDPYVGRAAVSAAAGRTADLLGRCADPLFVLSAGVFGRGLAQRGKTVVELIDGARESGDAWLRVVDSQLRALGNAVDEVLSADVEAAGRIGEDAR